MTGSVPGSRYTFRPALPAAPPPSNSLMSSGPGAGSGYHTSSKYQLSSSIKSFTPTSPSRIAPRTDLSDQHGAYSAAGGDSSGLYTRPL